MALSFSPMASQARPSSRAFSMIWADCVAMMASSIPEAPSRLPPRAVSGLLTSTAVGAMAADILIMQSDAVPVGKDSLSMKTVWRQGGAERSMAAPLSLIVSAFAPVQEIRDTLTPELRRDRGDSDLILCGVGDDPP